MERHNEINNAKFKTRFYDDTYDTNYRGRRIDKIIIREHDTLVLKCAASNKLTQRENNTFLEVNIQKVFLHFPARNGALSIKIRTNILTPNHTCNA